MSKNKHIAIIGAGIAGLMTGLSLLKRGYSVTLFDAGDADLDHNCSFVAGGMLAPWSEMESAEMRIHRLGCRSIGLWRDLMGELPGRPFFRADGTLILAHGQDRPDLERFRQRLDFAGLGGEIEPLDAGRLAGLEPELATRFEDGLYLPREAQIDPRSLLPVLIAYLKKQGAEFQFNRPVGALAADHIRIEDERHGFDRVIDCRGLAARDCQPLLRGVKGEVALIRCADVRLNRMVRLMHPRYPIYIAPRPDHHFLIGATSIETEDRRVTLRSTLELLSAAYSLHPAFGEAEIVDIRAHLRPTLPDHLPCLEERDGVVRLNGLYRHGYLIAPALAEEAADFIETGSLPQNPLMEDVA